MTPAATLAAAIASTKRAPKYRNVRVTVDGVVYDSKREAARHAELKVLQRVGKLMDLRRQVTFVLAPGVRIEGEKRARPALRYIADFVYLAPGPDGEWRLVAEDVKSAVTAKLAAFRMKQSLMKSVHGIDVRIVK